MDFDITDEQRGLVEVARDYGVRHLAPYYRQREAEGAFDRATLADMGRLGLFGVDLPEEHGGLGQDCLTAGLVIEALSASDYNLAYAPITVSLVGSIIARHGTPAAQEWIKGMVAGTLIPNIALTEPSAGSDAANLQLRAVREGSSWVLTGEKTSISMATQADVSVVFARTGPPDSRAHGISAFLVPLDDPTITRGGFADHGGRSTGRGTLHFDGTVVPAEHLIGEEHQGFGKVMAGFDYSRALIAIQSVAVARVSLDETWAFVQLRETFGKPLSERQGVVFPLAEAETVYEAGRLLCLKTLWLKDKGRPHTTEAAMCKWWPVQQAYDIVRTCLLTHGHAGYTEELPFEQRMRDLLGLQIGDGTAQIMKMVIGRGKLAAAGRGMS